MRYYRVDTKWGYAVYGEHDRARALELYEEQGVRLILMEHMHDPGTVISGTPVVVDLELEAKRHTLN